MRSLRLMRQRFRDAGFFRGLNNQLQYIFRSMSKSGFREAAREFYIAGEGLDGQINAITHPVTGLESSPATPTMTKMVHQFFKWNGLTWITDATRKAVARQLAIEIAEDMKVPWNELSPRRQHWYRQYGFDENQFGLIRQADVLPLGDIKGFDPSSLQNVKLDHFKDAIEQGGVEYEWAKEQLRVIEKNKRKKQDRILRQTEDAIHKDLKERAGDDKDLKKQAAAFRKQQMEERKKREKITKEMMIDTDSALPPRISDEMSWREQTDRRNRIDDELNALKEKNMRAWADAMLGKEPRTEGQIKGTGRVEVAGSLDKNLGKLLTEWTDTIGMKSDFVLASFQDAKGELAGDDRFDLERSRFKGDYGGWARQVADANYIIINGDHPKHLQIEALAHELGHHIMHRHFEDAPASVQKQIRDEYDNWKKEMESEEVKGFHEKMKPFDPKSRGKLGSFGLGDYIAYEQNKDKYYLSFSEYFAMQVAKYMTADIKPVSAIDKFFHRLVEAMKKVFNMGIKKALPEKNFNDYMDSLFRDGLGVESYEEVYQQTLDKKAELSAVDGERQRDIYRMVDEGEVDPDEPMSLEELTSLKENFQESLDRLQDTLKKSGQDKLMREALTGKINALKSTIKHLDGQIKDLEKTQKPKPKKKPAQKKEPEKVEKLDEDALRKELEAMKGIEVKNYVKERKGMIEGTKKAIDEIREKMKKVSQGSKEGNDLQAELFDFMERLGRVEREHDIGMEDIQRRAKELAAQKATESADPTEQSLMLRKRLFQLDKQIADESARLDSEGKSVTEIDAALKPLYEEHRQLKETLKGIDPETKENFVKKLFRFDNKIRQSREGIEKSIKRYEASIKDAKARIAELKTARTKEREAGNVAWEIGAEIRNLEGGLSIDRSSLRGAKEMLKELDRPQVEAYGTTTQEFGQILNEWIKNIGLDARFTIYDGKDFVGTKKSPPKATELGYAMSGWRETIANGLAGGFVTQFPETGRYLIVLDHKTRGKFDKIEIIAHELGHVVMSEIFREVPGHVRKAVWDEYNLWKLKQGDKTLDEFFATEYPHRMGQKAARFDSTTKMKHNRQREYFLSQNEWFANQVAKWLTTDIKPLTAVDKFFHRIFNALRNLFNKGVKHNLPGKNVSQFMDDLFAGRYNGIMESVNNEARDQKWSTWKADPDKKPAPKPKKQPKKEGKKETTEKPKQTEEEQAEEELSNALAELDAAEESGNEEAVKKARRRVNAADKKLTDLAKKEKSNEKTTKKPQTGKGKTGEGGDDSGNVPPDDPGGDGGGDGDGEEPELSLDELLALNQQDIDDLEAMAEKQKAKVYQEARREFEIKVRSMLTLESGQGVLKSDPKSKRVSTFGRRPGTLSGEIARMLMQFKQFPVRLAQGPFARAIFAERQGQKMNALGGLFLGLTIAGYIAMTVKDYGKGYGLRKPENAEDWKDLVLASMLQGGAAGIFGDFLFSDTDRFGNNIAATVAGPSAGIAYDFLRLLGSISDQVFVEDADFADVGLDALKFGEGVVPYVNHFLLRPGIEMLILNAIRDFLDPGSVRKGQRRREREYNQERHEHWPDNIFD